MKTRITKVNMLAILDTFSKCVSMRRKWQLAADDASVMIYASRPRIADQIIQETGLFPLWTAALRGLERTTQKPEDIAHEVIGEYMTILFDENRVDSDEDIIEQKAFDTINEMYREGCLCRRGVL